MRAPARGRRQRATLAQLLIIGDADVGKTCVIHRFCDKEYQGNYVATIGVHTR